MFITLTKEQLMEYYWQILSQRDERFPCAFLSVCYPLSKVSGAEDESKLGSSVSLFPQ